MNKFKKLILLSFIIVLSSCSSLKSTFVNEKKNNTDEFLVEKKSPLVMPPDYNELPIPKEKNNQQNKNENEFKTLVIQTDQNVKSDSNKDINKNFEELLLDRIKKN